MSRSSLEARVRAVLGRTVHQEIRRVQIDTAKTLLADTDFPIKQVAQRSGFKNVQYLTRVFSARSASRQPTFVVVACRAASAWQIHTLLKPVFFQLHVIEPYDVTRRYPSEIEL